MSNEQKRTNHSNSNRKQPKKSGWKRFIHSYGPVIRTGSLMILIVAVVAFGVSALLISCSNNDDPSMDLPGLSGTGEPVPPDSGNPDDNTSDAPTPPPVTDPPPATLSPSEIQKLADDLVKETDFIAAGYDYQKAIQMLQAFEYYDQAPALAQKVEEYKTADSKLVTYTNMQNVTHIFFHSLIVDTSRAFDGGASSDGYNLYMTTVDEFNAILEEMYNRGFVLVTPYQVAYEVTDGNGTRFVYGNIRLPEGKKPFIMSQDDLNYYGYMINGADGSDNTPVFAASYGDGFAHKIVIGADGYPTCEYMDANGNITTGDYDLVPCLETFIQKHPDFAYQGARAVLGMTGYEGVFGYRTKPAYEAAMGTEAYQKEVEQAKAVAQCLRDHGWILASHSYGHPAYGNISASRVEADSDKWEATVQPIIGDCDIILYPHGSDIAGLERYTFDNAKFKALYEDGYRYFFNVDSSVYWAQIGSNYYRGGRRNLDGYRMWHHPHRLDDLFDVEKVFDKARPTPVPSL